MNKDEELAVLSPVKDKCPCVKCALSMFGGWNDWRCAKFPNGKPDGILYDGDKCPEIVPINGEGEDMDIDEKIRKLLKAYGASESEIENFMTDLRAEDEDKTEKEEERSKSELYKSLREKGGSDLIIKLASMPKEEREKAIAEYLKD